MDASRSCHHAAPIDRAFTMMPRTAAPASAYAGCRNQRPGPNHNAQPTASVDTSTANAGNSQVRAHHSQPAMAAITPVANPALARLDAMASRPECDAEGRAQALAGQLAFLNQVLTDPEVARNAGHRAKRRAWRTAGVAFCKRPDQRAAGRRHHGKAYSTAVDPGIRLRHVAWAMAPRH